MYIALAGSGECHRSVAAEAESTGFEFRRSRRHPLEFIVCINGKKCRPTWYWNKLTTQCYFSVKLARQQASGLSRTVTVCLALLFLKHSVLFLHWAQVHCNETGTTLNVVLFSLFLFLFAPASILRLSGSVVQLQVTRKWSSGARIQLNTWERRNRFYLRYCTHIDEICCN